MLTGRCACSAEGASEVDCIMHNGSRSGDLQEDGAGCDELEWSQGDDSDESSEGLAGEGALVPVAVEALMMSPFHPM